MSQLVRLSKHKIAKMFLKWTNQSINFTIHSRLSLNKTSNDELKHQNHCLFFWPIKHRICERALNYPTLQDGKPSLLPSTLSIVLRTCIEYLLIYSYCLTFRTFWPHFWCGDKCSRMIKHKKKFRLVIVTCDCFLYCPWERVIYDLGKICSDFFSRVTFSWLVFVCSYVIWTST